MEFLPFLCLLLALSATFGIGGCFWSLLTPIFPIMTTLLMFKLFIDPAGSGCGNTTLLQDGRALSTQLALSLAIISFQLGRSVAIIPGSELQQYKSLTQATSINQGGSNTEYFRFISLFKVYNYCNQVCKHKFTWLTKIFNNLSCH